MCSWGTALCSAFKSYKKKFTTVANSWKQFSRGIDYLHKLYLYLNTQVTFSELLPLTFYLLFFFL